MDLKGIVVNSKTKTIVIVESPTKIKALSKYLGSQYTTIATVGHIRDLPSSELGVDLQKSFQPHYVTIKGKEKVIKELQSVTIGKDVLIATDPDREGEAIAWHVAEVIQKKANQFSRIEFEEITKTAVLNALKNPRKIDIDRVNAQQARRVLDRLVGYLVSPLLWKTVKTGISAGRVQSVALRLLCERENEILSFTTEEYWSIHADFLLNGTTVQTKLVQWDNEKGDRYSSEIAQQIVLYCEKQNGKVVSLETKTVRKNPPPPFTTSTMQQAASSKLSFGVRKTMTVAQQLYEGIDLPQEGPTGLITYMRSDSVRLANEATQSIRQYIEGTYGSNYLPDSIRFYKNKGESQDAHEAIRPTDVNRHPEEIKGYLSPDQFKLYDLIWKRTLACQMESARFERQTADIQVREKAIFRANGQRLLFDGYLKLYGKDDEEENGGLLPAGLEETKVLDMDSVTSNQHFTEPPARYNEANLVKELDELGIGRPSTYASIIQTLFDREYVNRFEKRIRPTPLGRVVNQLLVGEFPELFNVKFTAQMENELDEVEAGKGDWKKVVKELYDPLQKKLDDAQRKIAELKTTAFIETKEPCPNGHEFMQLRISRFGAYLRCPVCNATGKLNGNGDNPSDQVPDDLLNEPCEHCGKPMVLRQGKFGSFLGCSNYPSCKNIRKVPANITVSSEENGKKEKKTISITMEEVGLEGCPECGSPMNSKLGRFGIFFSCSSYPKCKGIVNVKRTKEGTYTHSVSKKSKNKSETIPKKSTKAAQTTKKNTSSRTVSKKKPKTGRK